MPALTLFILVLILTAAVVCAVAAKYCYWAYRRKCFADYALKYQLQYFRHKTKADIFDEHFFSNLPMGSEFENLLVGREGGLLVFDAFSVSSKQKRAFVGTFVAIKTGELPKFNVFPTQGHELTGTKLTGSLRFEGEQEEAFIRFWQLLAADFTTLSWVLEQRDGYLLGTLAPNSPLVNSPYPIAVRHFFHLSTLLLNFSDLIHKEYTQPHG